jgi:cytochrome c peroxidase
MLTAAAAIAALGAAGSVAAQQWQPLPEKAEAPEDNPTTEEKVELGKKLYFDPRLSETGTVSCNTCHNVMEGGDDGRPSSEGVHGRLGTRSAPTVWNAAFNSTQFWDGRADSLEEQAKGPLLAHVEMGMPAHDVVMERVEEIPGYVAEFKDVFGGEDPVNIDNAVKAIGAFERTLITPNSPYDKYAKGNEDALTEKQKKGMKAFQQAGCTSCHSGAAFNGPQMNMPDGQGFFQKFPTFTDNEYVEKYNLMADKGRYEATGKDGHEYMFRVPTLRNIELTAPYFHNGAVKTLPEAVRVMAKTQLNKDLSDEQVENIVAFLTSLTGEFPEITMPRLPSMSGESVLKGVTEVKEVKKQQGSH